VVRVHDASRDGQTESRAALFPAPRFVSPEEALEDVGNIGFCDSDAGILYFADYGIRRSQPPDNLNRAPGGRVLDGVVEENQP
jgi:hypothetical protein